MSRREDIDNGIWSDADFHALTPDAKLIYVWSFTNPRCGMAGLYKVVPGAISLETGIDNDRLTAALQELHDARFVLYARGVLWVRSRVKHLRTKTPQIAKSIARDVEQIGDSPLTRLFLAEYAGLGWLADPLQTLTRQSPDRHRNHGEQGVSGEPHVTVGGGSGDPPGYGQGREVEKNGPSRARKAAPVDELPDELPERLHAVAREVHARLLRLHERKPRSIRPPLAAVGRVLMSLPDRDHVTVADDVEHYWTFGAGQNKSMRDVVATYRNRLATAPVVAATANGAAPSSIDDIVQRAERRERMLEQQRRDREAAGASR